MSRFGGLSYEEIARDTLSSHGFTENFEDVSTHDYQGRYCWCAQNSDGLWASVGWSYGSCDLCDPTCDWTDDEYWEALTTLQGPQEDKPKAWW